LKETFLRVVVPGQIEQAFKVLRTVRNSPFWPCVEPEAFSAYKIHTVHHNKKTDDLPVFQLKRGQY
jgi:hypothetical protein